MLPLIPLAISLVPELIRLISGDKAGAVATSVAGLVETVTGTHDPAEAQIKLAADPALASELRIKLAQIALDAQREQDAAAEQRRQADLAAFGKNVENTAGARTAMVGLAQAGSAIAWGSPAISCIVAIGFFVVVWALFSGHMGVLDPATANVVGIITGVLSAKFADVVNFWLGSSEGSRNKDVTIAGLQAGALNLQAKHAEQMAQVVTATAAATTSPAPAPPADNFPRCLAVVLDKEGGFSNDPRDRGGPTNLGITHATLAAFREVAPEAVSIADVQNLTRQEATEIYRANYWLPARCNDLPAGVDLVVFDMGVNAGPRTSVKILQRVVGVTDDGSVGPITLGAVGKMAPAKLIEAFSAARETYYRSLSGFATFGDGWLARTTQVAALAQSMAA